MGRGGVFWGGRGVSLLTPRSSSITCFFPREKKCSLSAACSALRLALCVSSLSHCAPNQSSVPSTKTRLVHAHQTGVPVTPSWLAQSTTETCTMSPQVGSVL